MVFTHHIRGDRIVFADGYGRMNNIMQPAQMIETTENAKEVFQPS